ncbi:D-beta-hydroxybutyrate dehydrogenase, mitochondrial-like [Physella acuta]|uniref:D-beta-hydroxybutyrate dehydrogenase, mitochondrial-like n=1 Tax=Physella acuta TaxID=109671 RepID=UPI0027DBC135|nr:D-beta-hydroxybutyrate dehydrogenase, mitochondrial-like [Physella acuta]XP_059159514.1 D-beta-hydroxybutyrate dehydrogenase, mitochondrial-like [Physella acuta]XP_059159515.1 D-beta-hydroxybutyrate dehydrogenase, mitochondrial-like [Physella acuta]
MVLEDSLDLKKQRMLLLVSLYTVLAFVVYSYLYDILVLLVLLLTLWLIHDLIKNYTKEYVDPSGKYVYITGCDSGFGLEAAKALREIGLNVIAGCFYDSSPGAVELRARPWVKKIEVVILDVSNEASVLACAEEVKHICQDQGIWAVINNAGINCFGPAELVTMEMFHRCAEVNLFGAIRVIKSVLPLIRQAEGRIINVTSEAGFNPQKDRSPYCTTKFGLEAFSACLRKEMDPLNVKVITVAPGEFAGATSVAKQNINDSMIEKLLQSHSALSLQDQQNAYRKENIVGMKDKVQAAIERSCCSSEPVVNAYVDAVHNADPLRCYMVHGLKRKCLDPLIIMARCRPFIPEKCVHIVEKFFFAILN